jgi:starch synthase
LGRLYLQYPKIIMNITSAIFYKRDGYDTQDKRLLGRQSAGEGFLKALIQYGKADSIYCYTDTRSEFIEFCQRIQPWIQGTRQGIWIPKDNPTSLSLPGTLYHPDPRLSKLAWQRRFVDQKAYSLCGVTHTIASIGIMESMGDLLIAPLQSWDALICTSQAVKTAVLHILNNWAEYLAQRTGGKPNINIQLPIIPLGVDFSAFSQATNNTNFRQNIRQALNIPQEDIVVLFVGRLCFYAKAHPVPMYIALEKAAKATNQKIHLIQAGWFEDEREAIGFKESAKNFCPSVNCIFVDGRKPEIRQGIWQTADIFISLVDNIQETFGLTPIEAMASGLPVIVSDWDGYKESVRHGVDGLRIPSVSPASGLGLNLAADYLVEKINYSTYLAESSMATAIDINATTQALVTLITNPELRKKMGENGQQRVKETYDWQVIIPQYEQLWHRLAEIRTSSVTSAPLQPNTPPYPLCDDPFRLFSHYPTTQLKDDMLLGLGSLGNSEGLEVINKHWITNYGADKRLSPQIIQAILETIKEQGKQTVTSIRENHLDVLSPQLIFTLVYLLKLNILQIEEP